MLHVEYAFSFAIITTGPAGAPRSRDRQPALHTRNHGASFGFYRRARLGASGDRGDGAVRDLYSGASTDGPRLAGNLARGSNYFAFDRRLADGSKSAAAGNAFALWSRSQSRIQSFAADGGRRALDGSPVSSALDAGDSRDVATALWHGRSYWRDVFSGHRAGDGGLLLVIGRWGVIWSRSMGGLVDGGKLWSAI